MTNFFNHKNMNKSTKFYRVNNTDYKIIKLINKGSYGKIFLIEKKSNKEKYAAKIIELDGKEITKQMIEREVQIMMHLNHPTLVKFYGFTKIKESDGEKIMIVMKYYEKGSLSDVLSDEKKFHSDISYDETARQIILVGIAYGMMKLHRKNIVHRDLKPGNVLIDENYFPYITDFGLSKRTNFGELSQSTKTCGTPLYMAPEVIRDNQYSFKADVFSFGIIMYQVITGKTPYPSFQVDKWNEYKFYQYVAAEKGRPSFEGVQIKPSLKKLIESCWDHDPSKRPTFEEIFKKLAYNQDDSDYSLDIEDDDEDNNYYLDNASVDALFDYIDIITEVKDYGEEIEELRATVQNQQKIIDQLKKKTKESNQNQEKIVGEYQDLFQKQDDKIKYYIKLFEKQEELMREHNAQFKLQEETIQAQQKQIEEQQKQIEEQQKQIEEQRKQIEEQRKQIEEQKKQNEEKKIQIQEQNEKNELLMKEEKEKPPNEKIIKNGNITVIERRNDNDNNNFIISFFFHPISNYIFKSNLSNIIFSSSY